jgi:hypothetical protein
MALSLVDGRETDQGQRDKLYQKANILVDGFKQEFKEIRCPDLIQIDLSSLDAKEEYETRGLKSQCEGYIRMVTEKAAILISSAD